MPYHALKVQRVNTTTANAQSDVAIAALDTGGFAINWSSTYQDGATYGVYGRAYSASGTVIAGETRLSDAAAYITETSLAARSGGGWISTYSVYGGDGSGYGIFAQMFRGDGKAVGKELQINSTEADNQQDSDVALLSTGNFAISYASWNSAASNYDVLLQRIDKSGKDLGGEVRIGSAGTIDQDEASVAALRQGKFAVVYSDGSIDGSWEGIGLQLFNANGSKAGGPKLVNTDTSSIQSDADIVMLKNGSFIVTWQSAADGDYDIRFQQFAANGNRMGGEIAVNDRITGDQDAASIAALASGGFVVVWRDRSTSIMAQIYDAKGDEVGSNLKISGLNDSQSTYYESAPAVAGLENGDFVVSWSGLDNQTGSYETYRRTYDFTSTSAIDHAIDANNDFLL
ncbi:MAG: hypothetical protein RLZZ444_1779 [Pseudomonadota bacterium]